MRRKFSECFFSSRNGIDNLRARQKSMSCDKGVEYVVLDLLALPKLYPAPDREFSRPSSGVPVEQDGGGGLVVPSMRAATFVAVARSLSQAGGVSGAFGGPAVLPLSTWAKRSKMSAAVCIGRTPSVGHLPPLGPGRRFPNCRRLLHVLLRRRNPILLLQRLPSSTCCPASSASALEGQLHHHALVVGWNGGEVVASATM